MKKIYLDYAASTPVDPEVLRAMEPYFSEKFGNPGSLHAFGQEAIAAVDAARENIARTIGADFRQVVFTASATEANNLALRGTIRKYWWDFFEKNGKDAERSTLPHLVVAAIEHESLMETARDIERRGAARITFLAPEKNGVVNAAAVKAAVTEETVLVSVGYANNEIGVIQPIAEISALLREVRAARGSSYPLLHTDAAQALQFLDCSVKNLGVDLMTLSAHKVYGPKGIGLLYVKDAGKISPWATGGGQEFGLRSGTENVPAVVGFAKAFDRAVVLREKEAQRIAKLRDALWSGIRKIFPDAELNGPEESGSLPNMLNVYFLGHAAQDLLTKWDLAGLAASSASACRSRAVEPSYVLQALGYPRERALQSIRFSLGRPTTEKEIEEALAIIKSVLV